MPISKEPSGPDAAGKARARRRSGGQSAPAPSIPQTEEPGEGPFVLLFLRMTGALLREKSMTLMDWRVLLACVLRIQPYRGFIEVHQSAMATELHTYQANVSRALRRLVAKGVLVKLRGRTYQLNPRLASKSGRAERATARRMYRAVAQGQDRWIGTAVGETETLATTLTRHANGQAPV